MRKAACRRLSLATAIFALCALVSPAASWALPATAGTAEQIEETQKQQETAQAALQQAQLDFNVKTAEYIQNGRELDRTRIEISEVTSQIAQLDTSIVEAEIALTNRAIELYRGDRLNLLALVLDARSLSDFMTRANYLVTINNRHSLMVTGLRQARAESAWLHQHLAERVARQEALQVATEKQLQDLEELAEAQEKKAKELGEDLAELQRRVRTFAGGEAGAFDPDTIISDANYRDVGSMTVEEIQLFLENQPGTLDRYRARSKDGKMSSVAEIVAQAAATHRISPKVILVTLQKESSLLAAKSPKASLYDKAMGAGWGDSFTNLEYKGFGKQIWWGAQKLDKNTGGWRPGIERRIDGNIVRPTNEATWSLYKYTPHDRGNRSFSRLYWRYFGDPLAPPEQ